MPYDSQKPTISFQPSPEEWEILDKYCKKFQVSKTEVLRRFIRSLEKKIEAR